MEISFKNAELSSLVNSHKDLVRSFGLPHAQRISRRIADIAAAPTLEMLRPPFPGGCQELSGKHKGKWAIDVGHPLRLLFEACGIGVVKNANGKLEWSSVKSVRLLEVEDAND